MDYAMLCRRVGEIRSMSHDPEKAHVLEDQLHTDVLRAIADRAETVKDPVDWALTALATSSIEFPRWAS